MNILGIHLDFPYIRTCKIRKTRRKLEFETLETISLIEGVSGESKPDVKPLYIQSFRGKIATGLSASKFFIRPFEIKIAGKRHFEEAIAFQAEALSHLRPEDAMTVPLIETRDNQNVGGLLFTVAKEGLKEHLLQFEQLQIDPDAVSTVPSALCCYIKWKFPNLLQAVIIDLGSSETTCVLMEKGKLKKSHTISQGIEHLLSALHQDRKKNLLKKEAAEVAQQIDLLLLKPALTPSLSKELTHLRQELAKMYRSFCRDSQLPVIFTGRSNAFIHLSEFLIDAEKGEWSLSIKEQKFAISMGLALEQTHSTPLQLRQQEFFPQKNWRRMGLYAIVLLGCSAFLSSALLVFGLNSISSCKQEILDSLQARSPDHLLAKGGAEETIDLWIEEIEKNKKDYPYLLQAPKVAEVLSWISSHPLFIEFKNEGDSVDLREMKYQLTSFPSIHSATEPFLAKVELELHFKNAMNARKFLSALREGDDWVNPDLPISWEALSDSYRASFFLKNRSPYVP